MTRTTHRFLTAEGCAEVYVIVATPAEWDDNPASRDPRWSPWRGRSIVVATRLSVARDSPAPPSPATD